MQLRYKNPGEETVVVGLGDKPLIIGRSADADVTLKDDRVSRHHCEIRPWDGEFVLKDLKSQNGTFLNGERTQVATLQPGDHLKVGNTVISVELESVVGEHTALQEIEHEMEEGKGYRTILRSIVDDIEKKS